VKPSNGWYSRVNTETGEVEDKKFRAKETFTKDFWLPILTDKTFADYIKDKYQVSNGNIVSDEEVEDIFGN
jgi:hypothetical protein